MYKITPVILSGASGTRVHPHTLDRPKCMVEIDGISLIDRQLEVLSSEKLNNFKWM